jgi:hypothetical protein
VLVLSNPPLDLTVDVLSTWREQIPDSLTVAATRLDGVLPLVPSWLAARYPDLWASAKAVEHDIARAEDAEVSNPQTANKNLLKSQGQGLADQRGFYKRNGGLKAGTFRLEGRRGGKASRALIRADHPAPEAALAALVGPLAHFAWDDDAPSPPLAPLRPAPPPSAPGVIEDDDAPPLLGFGGQGPPLRPYDLAGLYRCGWRLIIDIVRLPRGSPDPEGFARVWVTVPRLEVTA